MTELTENKKLDIKQRYDMEKISCNIIEDLLPLYCDNVCSQDSRKMVEAHLQNCSACSELLDKMKTEYKYTNEAEEKQEEMVKNMASAWHRSLKKGFCRGVLITVCTCLLLLGGYLALTRLILIPVPLDMTQVTVETISDETVEIFLKVTDGKKVSSSSLKFTEDGKCFILLKRGVIPQNNGNAEPWTEEWSISKTGRTDEGGRVTIREIYCGTEDNNFLIWRAE